MASIPLAFSVHHFISSVGADAGFAAIIGLAIPVFLYFAQARETATLRDQAAESAQHIQELEERITHLSRSGAAASTITSPPAPAPPPPGVSRRAAPPPSMAAAGTAAAPGSARSSAPAGASANSPGVSVNAPSAPEIGRASCR